MDGFAIGALQIQVSQVHSSQALRLLWSGKGNDRQTTELVGKYLGDALAHAKEREVLLELHFEKLEYLSSSMFACLVQLIRSAYNAGVSLQFVYSGSVHWQRVNLEALRIFDRGDGRFALNAV